MAGPVAGARWGAKPSRSLVAARLWAGRVQATLLLNILIGGACGASTHKSASIDNISQHVVACLAPRLMDPTPRGTVVLLRSNISKACDVNSSH
eukprot:615094-Alexandrium_andersonii.AAC.1